MWKKTRRIITALSANPTPPAPPSEGRTAESALRNVKTVSSGETCRFSLKTKAREAHISEKCGKKARRFITVLSANPSLPPLHPRGGRRKSAFFGGGVGEPNRKGSPASLFDRAQPFLSSREKWGRIPAPQGGAVPGPRPRRKTSVTAPPRCLPFPLPGGPAAPGAVLPPGRRSFRRRRIWYQTE